MKDNLEEFARRQLVSAQKISRRGQELVPILVFENEDTAGVCAVPKYDRDREGARAAMTKLLIEKEAERYAFVMEAWFGTPPDPRPGKHKGYLPSKDDKRRECICVTAAQRDGTHIFLLCEIKRGKQGLVQFEEHKPDGGHVVGPLTDLFAKDTRQ